MAPTLRAFPQGIVPTGRSYKPGRLPQTFFEAQNGAVSIIQYGQNFVNAELTLDFNNISDEAAADLLVHYESMVHDDYVIFDSSRGWQGIGADLQGQMQDGKKVLRWRYKEPPQMQSIYPGVSTVQLQFIGLLYGA
tara:strand:+ start:282 stop:689 length:408 start_codon:yes stop_codon:yes gene_type:complete